MATVTGTAHWSDRRTEPGAWVITPTSDFWLACGGAGVLLIALALVLHWHGDRELQAADLLLAELHLGATYDAVVRRRLWQHMPFEVIAVPLAITAAAYGLMFADRSDLVTTAVLYLAVWHRARQNLGIARSTRCTWAGRCRPGTDVCSAPPSTSRWPSARPTSPARRRSMKATSSSPSRSIPASSKRSPSWPSRDGSVRRVHARHRARIHPGEWWLVVANAVAFGSGYVLGARSMSFMLVLALHHEVQYLFFTYAMARRSAARVGELRGELRLLASFALWPMLGLTSWALCQLSVSDWVPPFLVSGLLCHYWLDGRIWRPRACRLAT